MRRRTLLLSPWLCAPFAATALRTGPKPTTPLRLGADVALADAGLARSLQQGFGRDTGIPVQVVRMPALALLEALAAGELDAGLANAPGAEEKLDAQGLVHDRRRIGSGEFVLVGPLRRGPGPLGGSSLAAALSRLREVLNPDPAAPVFLTAGDGSGAHVFEQATWREAGIAPEAPWYVVAAPRLDLVSQARARRAYAIVERGAWLTQGGNPLAILVDRDPRGVESIHVMRSFRSPHPAGKLFLAWIAGPQGRAVVGRQRGYRAA